MNRCLIVLMIGIAVAGCGQADHGPITEKQAVSKCQHRIAKSHHVERFKPDVSAYNEDGLWEIRGETVRPEGDYHCTLVAATGVMGVAGFAAYQPPR